MNTQQHSRRRNPRVRANGEGSVFRLPDGRWRATKTAGFTSEGKQKLVTGSGATREIAIARRDAAWKRWLVSSGQAPLDILSEPESHHAMSVEEWFYLWRVNMDRNATSELYRRQILSRIELHIGPAFRETSLRMLTRQDIERWMRETLPAKRKADGTPLLSNSSIVNIFQTLSLGLDEAVRAGHIPANPAKSVQRPRRSRARVDVERNKWVPLYILQKVEGTDAEAFYLLKMLYGLRISELLGLTDDSFLLSSRNPRIVVKQQLKRRDVRHGCGRRMNDGTFPCGRKTAGGCPNKEGVSGWYLGDPKTESGIRSLPLVEPALSAVREHLTRQKKLRKSQEFAPSEGLENLIFTKPNGRPITPNDATRAWHALLIEYNIPYMRGHEIRHLTATLLAEAGVSLEITKRILGHSEAAMSAYYTHIGEMATRQPLESLAEHITSRQRRSQE